MRFVLLRHTFASALPAGAARENHWDLMLEQAPPQGLATWALGQLPEPEGNAASAKKLPDHRTAYLTYEGEVSGGRGHVRRVDEGTYAVELAREQQWVIRLAGTMLRGRLTLTRELGTGDEHGTWTAALAAE